MDDETDFAVKHLIALFSSSDDLARTGACESLIAIGRPAVPFLVEALKDPNYLVRWEAANVLDAIGDPTAARALVRVLEDDTSEVRWRAAEGLSKMGVDGLKPLLKALIEDAQSATLREGAHHILHRVARGELRDFSLPVLNALESGWASVEAPKTALAALENLERFQGAQKETQAVSSKESMTLKPGQSIDLRPHERARRYAESLRYQAFCSESPGPDKIPRSEGGSVLCVAR